MLASWDICNLSLCREEATSQPLQLALIAGTQDFQVKGCFSKPCDGIRPLLCNSCCFREPISHMSDDLSCDPFIS